MSLTWLLHAIFSTDACKTSINVSIVVLIINNKYFLQQGKYIFIHLSSNVFNDLIKGNH